MLLNNLDKLSRDELVVLAMKQGLPKPHHKTKSENIIKIIMDSVVNPVKPIHDKVSVPVPTPITFSTPEQVEEAIADIKAKTPALQSIYDNEAKCVTFRCNGAEDCVSLSVRLKARPEYPMGTSIYNKAKSVSRGRFALRGHDLQTFDNINASGKNAYTNAVLA